MTTCNSNLAVQRFKRHVLLVDDEPFMLSSLRRLFRAFPCHYRDTEYEIEITAFSKPQDALEHASRHSFDLVITDFRMPEMNGIEFLTRLRQTQPDMKRILLTSAIEPSVTQNPPEAAGIDRFLSKPCNESLLLDSIAELLYLQSLAGTNDFDQSRLGS